MPKIIADEDIFQAVIQVVIERGFTGATTKQMADAAEVSEVTLFRKYGSKLQLVKQAIEAIIEKTGLQESVMYTGDVRADLLRVVQAYQDSAVRNGQFIASLLSELPRHPELMEMTETPFGIFSSIGRLLNRYQAEGVLRQEHPMHALAALLGPLIYSAMMRNAAKIDQIPPLNLAQHVDNYIHGRKVRH